MVMPRKRDHATKKQQRKVIFKVVMPKIHDSNESPNIGIVSYCTGFKLYGHVNINKHKQRGSRNIPKNDKSKA